jgi:hypothetical protein
MRARVEGGRTALVLAPMRNPCAPVLVLARTMRLPVPVSTSTLVGDARSGAHACASTYGRAYNERMATYPRVRDAQRNTCRTCYVLGTETEGYAWIPTEDGDRPMCRTHALAYDPDATVSTEEMTSEHGNVYPSWIYDPERDARIAAHAEMVKDVRSTSARDTRDEIARRMLTRAQRIGRETPSSGRMMVYALRQSIREDVYEMDENADDLVMLTMLERDEDETSICPMHNSVTDHDGCAYCDGDGTYIVGVLSFVLVPCSERVTADHYPMADAILVREYGCRPRLVLADSVPEHELSRIDVPGDWHDYGCNY